MRQIHVCAWLLLTSLASVACDGEKFASEPSPGTPAASEGTPVDDASAVPPAAGGAATAVPASQGWAGEQSEEASAASAGAADLSQGAAGRSNVAVLPPKNSEDCANGAVTFHMVPGPELEQNYLCDAGCGTGWLSITGANGAVVFSLFPACGTASCDSCEVQPCAAAACLPTPLTAVGADLIWHGSYLANDVCGGAKTVCQRQTCVTPGKYKARACAAVNGGLNEAGGCLPKDEQLCADVEFELPGTGNVELVLRK